MEATRVAPPSTTERPDGPERPARSSLRNALAVRDFRLLWIGQSASSLGDQFMIIALPWFVLQLTGDPLALGITLALQGIPRALFMLLGGAITDHVPSRTVMLVSDLIRLAVTALMAVLMFAGQVQMWMLYAGALIFGIVSGFFTPAATSIVPRLVPKEDLQAANGLFQGSAQLSIFVGPLLAGGLIALLGKGASPRVPGALTGIALCVIIDAVSFLVSVLTLWLMRAEPLSSADGPAQGARSVLASVWEGLRSAWGDPMLRTVLVLIAGMNLLFTGPVLVGIPVLAKDRLPEGAAAYGLLMSGYAGGNILGYVLSSTLKTRRLGLVGTLMMAVFGIAGVVFGLSASTWLDFVVLFLLGAGTGYLAILFLTWLQTHTPASMLGRMMSLVLFFLNGLAPVSQALSGAIVKLSLSGLFVGAGVSMLLLSLFAGANRQVSALEL